MINTTSDVIVAALTHCLGECIEPDGTLPHQTTRQSTKPGCYHTGTMTLPTLTLVLADAVHTFHPDDVGESLCDAYCPVANLRIWIHHAVASLFNSCCGLDSWIEVQPTHASCRFGIAVTGIADQATGESVPHYVTLEVLTPLAAVSPDSEARVSRDELTFRLAIQSLTDFYQDTPGWEKRNVLPVALSDNGLEFEEV